MLNLSRPLIVLGRFFLLWMLSLAFPLAAQPQPTYNGLSIYVCAHQDDWQLFMGASVFKDINDFDETNPSPNGKKVVIIYTTAGNLNDDDDTRSCNCRSPFDNQGKPFPYWKVREAAAKNSVHLAACRIGGWGPGIPYPGDNTTVINGHRISKYTYKNTVNYFLRMKAVSYGQWYYRPGASVGTVDSTTTYADYTDFVNTLYYIYKTEIDSSLTNNNISINCQDMDETINPNDHHDHLTAGRAASEAARILGNQLDTCIRHNLFVDYNSQNMPVNLSAPDIQNEAAVTGAYCLALLDYNAWPEWGKSFQDWTGRNYFRSITTCESPAHGNIMAQDSLEQLNVKIYPIPAGDNLFVRFNIPVKPDIDIEIYDAKGANLFHYKGPLHENNFPVRTADFPAGYYLIIVSSDNHPLTKTIFEVAH